MEELKCPYCDYPQYTHEPDDFTSHCCNIECENCGRTFEYSVIVTREYFSSRMDGEEDG